MTSSPVVRLDPMLFHGVSCRTYCEMKRIPTGDLETIVQCVKCFDRQKLGDRRVKILAENGDNLYSVFGLCTECPNQGCGGSFYYTGS